MYRYIIIVYHYYYYIVLNNRKIGMLFHDYLYDVRNDINIVIVQATGSR